MAELLDVFLVVFVIFLACAGLLAAIQRLTRKPLPVGCTPVDGECCLQSGSKRTCSAQAQRLNDLEVRNAGG
jgi:hypothetical protein